MENANNPGITEGDFIFYFLVGMGFELGALHLQNRHSTT
jgi:hypothetical protein